MPTKYRHVRKSIKLMKNEYYSAVRLLKAELHMSERQAQGSMCVVANTLFGREKFGKWKMPVLMVSHVTITLFHTGHQQSEQNIL